MKDKLYLILFVIVFSVSYLALIFVVAKHTRDTFNQELLNIFDK